MKQLAVEWLVGKILTKDEIYDYYGNVIGYKLINTYTSSEDFSKYVEKAKAMEKEQIIEAWMVIDNELQRIGAEKYYKKTYESNT